MTKKEILHGALVVTFGALIWLAANAPFYGLEELHISGRFVDQAGYISTARLWLDTGRLESGLVYPAYALQPDWRPYMPGHYAALALAYMLFGYGVFTSLLPSLLGYLLACVSVFVVGARRGGARLGFVAAALFALVPANVGYAFTAMAELTLTGAAALALLALVFVPRKQQPWAVPLVLVLPFLFRETAALCVLPLLLIAGEGLPRRWARLALGFVAAVALLFLVNAWQVQEGKGSLPLSWLTEGGFNYANAFAPDPPDMSAGDWVSAMWHNFQRNLGETAQQLQRDPLQVSTVGLGILLVGSLVAVLGAWRGDRNLGLGAAGLVLGALALTYFLYDVRGQKSVRGMLFTTPYLALGVAGVVARLETGRLFGFLACAALITGGHLGARRAAFELQVDDAKAREGTQLLEELRHPENHLLLSWFDLRSYTMDYTVRHYPVRWSFVPSNRQTYDEVVQRHRPGTLLLSKDLLEGRPPPPRFHAGPLLFQKTVTLGGKDYVVYQQP